MLTAEEWEILGLSLRVAIACVVISLPAGIGLGWLLARCDFRGKAIVDGILHLPLVLPPVVTGYFLLVLFGKQGPLGQLFEDVFGIQFAFDWKGAVLASAIVGFPLMLRAIRLAIEGVDERLEGVARTLGSSRWRAFVSVTLPIAAPGVVAGALLSFARSLGEFGATITFVSNIQGETRTIPSAIFTYLNQPGGEAPALRLVVVSVVLSLAATVASEIVSRRMRRD